MFTISAYPLGAGRYRRRLGIVCAAAVLLGCGATVTRSADSSAPVDPLDDPATLARWGQGALHAGDSVRAEQYLALALNRGVAPERVLPLLIRACLEGGRLRAALGYAEVRLADHPEEQELRFLVATIHAGLDQHGAAIVELKRILDRDPGHVESHYLLGVLLEQRDPGGAREHFSEYLAREPQGAHAAAVRGRLAHSTRPEELAIPHSEDHVEAASRTPKPDADMSSTKALPVHDAAPLREEWQP